MLALGKMLGPPLKTRAGFKNIARKNLKHQKFQDIETTRYQTEP